MAYFIKSAILGIRNSFLLSFNYRFILYLKHLTFYLLRIRVICGQSHNLVFHDFHKYLFLLSTIRKFNFKYSKYVRNTTSAHVASASNTCVVMTSAVKYLWE